MRATALVATRMTLAALAIAVALPGCRTAPAPPPGAGHGEPGGPELLEHTRVLVEASPR